MVMVRDNSKGKGLIIEGEGMIMLASENPKGLLADFERIVELAKGSGLSNAFFEQASDCIASASGILGLSEMQTVLLALFVDRSYDSRILLSDIGDYVGCSATKMMRLSSDVEVLVSKSYLRASRGHRPFFYRVPSEVLEALNKNEPYVRRKVRIEDTRMFFSQLNIQMQERESHEIEVEELIDWVKEHLAMIPTSHLAQMLEQFSLSDEDLLTFLFIAYCCVKKRDEAVLLTEVTSLLGDGSSILFSEADVLSKGCPLFVKNLIESVSEDTDEIIPAYRLTSYAKIEVLSELKLKCDAQLQGVLESLDQHPPRKMFYNTQEAKQVDELIMLLSEDNFRKVREGMQKSSCKMGFCCLFYGDSGTGKTETVYQIAHATGRGIMRVRLDEFRSRWVGKSEQNVKEIFENYKTRCSMESRIPILLFNEADGIFGVRTREAERSMDKMENTLQNIILQEMEDLDGIMIATTNLTCNLDPAFERRFLYKIKFCKPSERVRAQIWQAMLPGLVEKGAKHLASRFDFAGGEIENVIRKYIVKSVLLGLNEVDVPVLEELCTTERINDTSDKKIGFMQPIEAY